MNFNEFIAQLEEDDNLFESVLGLNKSDFDTLNEAFLKAKNDGTKKLDENERLFAFIVYKKWQLTEKDLGKFILQSKSNYSRDGETFSHNVESRFREALNLIPSKQRERIKNRILNANDCNAKPISGLNDILDCVKNKPKSKLQNKKYPSDDISKVNEKAIASASTLHDTLVTPKQEIEEISDRKIENTPITSLPMSDTAQQSLIPFNNISLKIENPAIKIEINYEVEQFNVNKIKKEPPILLHTNQKLRIFKELQKAKADDFKAILISAALNLLQFPFPRHLPQHQQITSLQMSYLIHKDNPIVRQILEEGIKAYIVSEGFSEFLKILREKFDECLWNSGFLTFIASNLSVSIEAEPLVELAIKEGKIYWRIIKGDQVLYDRTQVRDRDFTFIDVLTTMMTWQQFRIFKDAGKRSSTIAITQERFLKWFQDEYSAKNVSSDTIKAIWKELKKKGILDTNNRLSKGWRATFGQYKTIKLESIEDSSEYRYEDVRDALYDIANNRVYAEQIPHLQGMIIYRPERSAKKWASTGQLTNLDPTHLCSSKLWDVSTYRDLDSHRNTEEEEQFYKHKLNYDHIPSSKDLQDFQKTIPIKGDKEVSELWWCIAIPEKLHHQGETYKQSNSQKLNSLENPFSSNVEFYLNKLENHWNEFLPSPEEYLKALGAFRYLYRCQSKPFMKLSENYEIGSVPYTFFQTKGKLHKIDQLFHTRLKHYLEKSEGLQQLKVEQQKSMISFKNNMNSAQSELPSPPTQKQLINEAPSNRTKSDINNNSSLSYSSSYKK